MKPENNSASEVLTVAQWHHMASWILVNIGPAREWLAAWWHQAISWTSVDIASNMSWDINLMLIL